MSAWLRTPERVPAGFARDAEAAAAERPARPVRPARSLSSFAARMKLKLAAAREARLTSGAASW